MAAAAVTGGRYRITPAIWREPTKAQGMQKHARAERDENIETDPYPLLTHQRCGNLNPPEG